MWPSSFQGQVTPSGHDRIHEQPSNSLLLEGENKGIQSTFFYSFAMPKLQSYKELGQLSE